MKRSRAVAALLALAPNLVMAAESVFDSTNVTRSILSLVVIIAMVVLLAWGVRRIKGLNLNPSASEGLLRIVAQQSLGIKEKLVLVDVGQRRVLLGVSQGNIRYLADAEPGAQTQSDAGIPRGAVVARADKN